MPLHAVCGNCWTKETVGCYNISYVSVCALLKVWTLDSEW